MGREAERWGVWTDLRGERREACSKGVGSEWRSVGREAVRGVG